jgi:3'-phosphoadenosine 5'-phosphosulfate sulfotransferase (PAPS reductase)/FAD synthetase
MQHIVALSGGKDSTAMALRLRETEPGTDFTYVCTPTGNELPEMAEHWLNLQRLLGTRLTVVGSGASLGSLIDRWNALPNWRQRWCTKYLKIQPFERYVAAHLPATVYVGIRADEADARNPIEYGPQVTRRFPLAEWGWGLADVLDYLACRGVRVPDRTDCAACFFQTLGEWHALWTDHPDRYAEAERWEAQTGYTFRSPRRDSQPASLADLRAKFEAGYEPRRTTMNDRRAMCSVCAH